MIKHSVGEKSEEVFQKIVAFANGLKASGNPELLSLLTDYIDLKREYITSIEEAYINLVNKNAQHETNKYHLQGDPNRMDVV